MLTLENIRSLYSTSPNAYLILLPDAPRFTIADANEAFLSITNTHRSDIIGKGIFEAFPDNPIHHGLKGIRAVKSSLEHALLLKKNYKKTLQRYDLKKSDGFEVCFWSYDTFPLLDENNNVKYIVQNPVDVTSSVISQYEQTILQNTGG